MMVPLPLPDGICSFPRKKILVLACVFLGDILTLSILSLGFFSCSYLWYVVCGSFARAAATCSPGGLVFCTWCRLMFKEHAARCRLMFVVHG